MNLIEVLCNKCKCERFRVIKPDEKLPDDHWYFTCPECIRKRNCQAAEIMNAMGDYNDDIEKAIGRAVAFIKEQYD